MPRQGVFSVGKFVDQLLPCLWLQAGFCAAGVAHLAHEVSHHIPDLGFKQDQYQFCIC